MTKDDEDSKEGVSNADIKMFLAFLRKRRAPRACIMFADNKAKRPINKMESLNDYPLDLGVYEVGASDSRNIKHCFVLRVFENNQER